MVNESAQTAAAPVAGLTAKLAEVEPLAKDVATLRERTMEQEAKTLEGVMEKIKSLMPTVAGKIEVGYFCAGGQFSTDHRRYADRPGLVIVDQFGRESFGRGCSGGESRGEYIGWRLVLWENGTFGCLKRAGEWSRWQGEPSEWYIDKEEDLTTEQAVRRFGLAAIVQGLADEIVEASERLKSQRADYEARLAMIARIREAMG